MVINHLLTGMILQVVGNILPGRSPLELRACPAPMGEGVYHAPGYSAGADEDRGNEIHSLERFFEGCFVLFWRGMNSQLYEKVEW